MRITYLAGFLSVVIRQSIADKKIRRAARIFQKTSRRTRMNFRSLQYSMETYG